MLSKYKCCKSLLSVVINSKDLRLHYSFITLTVSIPKCIGKKCIYGKPTPSFLCHGVWLSYMIVVYVGEPFCNISETCFCSYIHFITLILKLLFFSLEKYLIYPSQYKFIYM